MGKLVYHADRIGPHRGKTPEGYLLALGVPIARTGWQTYRASELKLDSLPPDTLIEVYRDASEVFDPATIASFEGKTVTSPHPPVFLTPDNDRTYNLGHTQQVRKGENLDSGEGSLISDLLIKDSRLIHYLNSNAMNEISCGYSYDLVPMEDEHSPNHKFRMTNIRGNHVAIVPSGRAGREVRVLDANLEEGELNVEAEKVSVFKEFTEFFKSVGLRLVATDANSETVETQEEKARLSKELRMRTLDSEKEEKEMKDRKAKDEEEEKKMKDAEEKEDKEKKEASDARDKRFDRLMDAFEKMTEKKTEDAACTCDAEEGEPHAKNCPQYTKAEDADLIPVETLPKEDRPKNPIPGADAALAKLRSLKSVIADSGDKAAIRDYNEAVRALKGKTSDGSSAYTDVAAAASREDKNAAELRSQIGDAQKDPAKISADFEKEAARWKGKNPADVKAEVLQ